MDELSKRLRALRTDSGRNQTQLAECLNVTQTVVSSWENGREPSCDTLVKLAHFYNVSTDYLLGASRNKMDTDDLTAAVEAVAAKTEAAGELPATATDLLRLVNRVAAYLDAQAPAGLIPVAVLRRLVLGMDDLFAALLNGSVSASLDAVNAVLRTLLDVSEIPGFVVKNGPK